MPFRGVPDLGEIAEFQMHIVEQICDKTLGRCGSLPGIGRSLAGRRLAGGFIRFLACLRGQSSGLFDLELGDDLRLAFVENLTILFMKIPDGMPLRVANYRAQASL